MQPIFTQTVGAGGVGAVTFNSIPQTFTDLMVVASTRSTFTSGFDSFGLYLNGSQSNISNTSINGSGSGVTSTRSTYRAISANDSAFATANTFANIEIYIPNYTAATFKQMIVQGVTENNAIASNLNLVANLWSQTAAITSLSFDNSTSGQNFVQYSTFSLYGITKG